MKLARAWLLLPLLVSGCAKELSSNVAQDRIYADYRVEYSDTSRELRATATFYFGGSTGTFLELDGESNVTFNGAAMKKNSTIFNSVAYESTVAVPGELLNTGGTFVYTNNEGKTFTNTSPALGLLRAQYPTSASLAGSLAFSWTGTKGWGNEWFRLKYAGKKDSDGKDSAGTEPLPMPSPSATTGNVTLAADRLKNWGAGTYKVQICRESSENKLTQATSAGGRLFASTCDAKAEIKITP